MSQKQISLVVGLFVVIVIGMFTFAYLKQSELKNTVVDQPETQEPVSVPYPNITRIDAKHYFIDGVHTLVGEVEFPTPCDLLDANATVMESAPEQVRVDFTVINTAETCVQTVTAQRFKVEFTASEDAVITGTFMGRDIILNLFPAGFGETPDEFELFIKG